MTEKNENHGYALLMIEMYESIGNSTMIKNYRVVDIFENEEAAKKGRIDYAEQFALEKLKETGRPISLGWGYGKNEAEIHEHYDFIRKGIVDAAYIDCAYHGGTVNTKVQKLEVHKLIESVVSDVKTESNADVMDVPLRPADVEQREGIMKQREECNSRKIHHGR